MTDGGVTDMTDGGMTGRDGGMTDVRDGLTRRARKAELYIKVAALPLGLAPVLYL